MNRAVPGSIIHLAPGTYPGDVITKVNGTELAPITIEGTDTGTESRQAAARRSSPATSRVFSINNSYYRLSGFTIDGEPALKTTVFPGTLASVKSFKDSIQSKVNDSSLIFFGALDTVRGIHGVVIDDMVLVHAGGDCVRFANGAHNNTIERTTIAWCGLLAHPQSGVYSYHNGEGIYLGTSPKSTDRSMHADDNTSYNLIADNVINTYGSECLDVKENSHDNVFRNNTCEYNAEPLVYQGSNIEIRGYRNTVGRQHHRREHGLRPEARIRQLGVCAGRQRRQWQQVLRGRRESRRQPADHGPRPVLRELVLAGRSTCSAQASAQPRPPASRSPESATAPASTAARRPSEPTRRDDGGSSRLPRSGGGGMADIPVA